MRIALPETQATGERRQLFGLPPQGRPRPPRGSAARLSAPRLLFPTHRAGRDNRLRADLPHAVPRRGYFAMDEQTGTEKLYVVISDRRRDLDDCFDPRSGEVRQRSGSADPQAIARLESRLARWKKNAAVELVPKGIVHQVESYGVSLDPSQPAAVEIDLKHYR